MSTPVKFCVFCGSQFQSTNAWHKYCSDKCKYAYNNNKKERTLLAGRFCRQCGIQFFPDLKDGKNKQHCSPDCSKKSARESRSKFWERLGDKKKEKMSEYYAKSREKVGPDGNLKRFFSRNPDAPRSCQSCGESRVLDIAHKPGHERNGAWRSAKNTTPEKIWILCPTCHSLLDRMNYSPDDLGLS